MGADQERLGKAERAWEEVSTMKREEIRERYQGEWVLIKFGSMADLDEDLLVIEGEVVAHARSWQEIQRADEQASRPGNYTVEFMGDHPPNELDEDIVIVL